MGATRARVLSPGMFPFAGYRPRLPWTNPDGPSFFIPTFRRNTFRSLQCSRLAPSDAVTFPDSTSSNTVIIAASRMLRKTSPLVFMA